MKIYTRKGDDGSTSLMDGTRVFKNNLRVDAYGDVDELNSFIGLACSRLKDAELVPALVQIQKDLFALGAQLASPKREPSKEKAQIPESRIAEFEKLMDKIEDEVGPIREFILPSGAPEAALLHVCRSVARRAERKVVQLSQSEKVAPFAIKYLNRLSDLLFMMARAVNKRAGAVEVKW